METSWRGLPRTPQKLLNRVQKAQLIGVDAVRNAAMSAIINAAEESWIANLEDRPRTLPAARMARFFPYFVESAGIAAVSSDEVDRSGFEPAGDPNVDRVLLGQPPSSLADGARRNLMVSNPWQLHGTLVTTVDPRHLTQRTKGD